MSLSTQKKQSSSNNSEREALDNNSVTTVAEIVTDRTSKKDENASMEAFSSPATDQAQGETVSAKDLRKAAVEEAGRYLVARTVHEDDADRASWALIQIILRIAETFETPDSGFDEARFQQFLKENGAPPRTNAGSDWHRLAKACVPRGMKFSKLGGQLHALRANGIKSDAVLKELDQRKPVKEGGPSHFGANRFFLLYQETKRAQAEIDNADQEPTNPYEKWPESKLLEHGMMLFQVIWKQDLLPSQFEGLEAALEAAYLAE